MVKQVTNYNIYEDYIRIGHTATGDFGNYICTDLQNFPTPGQLKRKLHDVDKDAFTDLRGFTHRNRVRHDVEDLEISFPILSDADEQTILQMISPDWIYVELVNKKTGLKEVHKMYASDKQWDTFIIFKDEQGNWHSEDVSFTFSLVEE